VLVVRFRLGGFSYTSRNLHNIKQNVVLLVFLIARVSLDFQISLLLTIIKNIFYKIFGE
jgi:hypothetical protein